MEERTLSLRIQGVIEELKGGEDFEQKLAQKVQSTLNNINSVATNFQATADQQTQILPQADTKAIKSLVATVNESVNTLMNKFTKELEEFDRQTEIYGLTKRQQTKWRARFDRVGTKTAEDEEAMLSYVFRERRRGADEYTREIIDNLEIQVKDHFKKIRSAYQEFADSIPEYGRSVEEFKKTNNSLFEMLRQGGYLALAQQIGEQVMGIIKGFEQIEARNMTAFNFTNVMGNYNEIAQARLFEETTKTSMIAGGIGSIIGGLAGGFLGGGEPLMIAGGMSVGVSIGNQIAELININTRAEVERELKFLNQSYQEANADYQRAENYEIGATRVSARFHENVRGSSGLGYTPEQELAFKEQFGEALRDFDRKLYREQLTFSRATGLNFTDVNVINNLTRFNGEKFGVERLAEVQQFAQSIYGNDDNKRIIDVLTSIRDINLKQLNRSIQADEREISKFLAIPQTLFGVDNPYGRLGELGNKTLQILEGLITPTSKAHEAFLFQSLGEKGIVDFNERMKGGLFSGDNLEKILDFAKVTADGDKNVAYWMLNSMLKNAPKGFIDPMATLISGGEIEIQREQGKPKEKVNLEKFEEYIQEGIHKTGKSAEEIANQYLGLANKNKTIFETTEEKIANIQIEIGNKWKEILSNSQVAMSELQRQWLSSGTTMEKVSNMLNESLSLIKEKLKEFGIEFRSEDEIKQDAINEKYNWVYKFSHQEAKDGESLSDYMNRTLKKEAVANVGDGWGSRKFTKEQQIKFLEDKFAEIDAKAHEEVLHYYKQHDLNTYNRKYAIEELDRGREFRAKAENELRRRLKDKNYTIQEISGFRTLQEQEELKRQGRPASDTSYHLSGQAFDLAVYDAEGKPITTKMITEDLKTNKGKKYADLRKELEQYAKEYNLFWGGWFKDEKLRNQEWFHFQNNVWSAEENREIINKQKQYFGNEIGQVRKKPNLKATEKVELAKKNIKVKENVETLKKNEPKIEAKPEIKKEIIKEIPTQDRKGISLEKSNSIDTKPLEHILNELKTIVAHNQNKPIEIKVQFDNIPLEMMDSVQNAMIGVS